MWMTLTSKPASGATLSRMYERYGVGAIYVAEAFYNLKADPKPALEVTLKRITPAKTDISHASYTIHSTETLDTLMVRASNDIARNLYKLQTIDPIKIEFARLKEINARINTSDIHEWEDLRKKLLTHGNIVGIRLTSISFYETTMVITFKGTPDMLRQNTGGFRPARHAGRRKPGTGAAMRERYASMQNPRFRLWFWLASIVLFFCFLSLIEGILLPFVVGMLAAYFLDPAVTKLSRRGWSRTAAAAFITIGFFLLAVILCVVLTPLIAHQLSALIRDFPSYLHGMQVKYADKIEYYIAKLDPEQVSTIRDAVGNFGGGLVSWGGKMASNLVQSGLAILNILSLIFITPIVAFYLLRDWNKLVMQFDHLLPRDHAATIREQLHKIDQTLSGFIRGQTNVCLILATYFGLALSLLGLNFGLVIGILTGFLFFLPYIGVATGFLLSCIVAVFQFGFGAKLAGVVVVYGIGLITENSFLTPRLVGDKVGLHPLWVIFGILAGGDLFGFVGILIAVPATAIIGVLVKFATARYLQSSLYRGTPQAMISSPLITLTDAE